MRHPLNGKWEPGSFPGYGLGVPGEIKIVSHSNLIYWWPVWVVGFVLAGLSWIDGHLLAIVPDTTHAEQNCSVETPNGKINTPNGKINERDVLIVIRPEKGEDRHLPVDSDGKPLQPKFHMALSHSYGVVFALVLLFIIIITNVPLRGLWSWIVILVLVLLFTILHYRFGLGKPILHFFTDYLSIYMNAGGYLFISLVLLVVWLVTYFFFDRQIYMIFTPGQAEGVHGSRRW